MDTTLSVQQPCLARESHSTTPTSSCASRKASSVREQLERHPRNVPRLCYACHIHFLGLLFSNGAYVASGPMRGFDRADRVWHVFLKLGPLLSRPSWAAHASALSKAGGQSFHAAWLSASSGDLMGRGCCKASTCEPQPSHFKRRALCRPLNLLASCLQPVVFSWPAAKIQPYNAPPINSLSYSFQLVAMSTLKTQQQASLILMREMEHSEYNDPRAST